VHKPVNGLQDDQAGRPPGPQGGQEVALLQDRDNSKLAGHDLKDFVADLHLYLYLTCAIITEGKTSPRKKPRGLPLNEAEVWCTRTPMVS